MLARQTDGAPVAKHKGVAVTIAIIDYGVGNLASVKKALDHVGADSTITSDPKVVAKAEKIVLPGVGHFSATSSLDRAGLRDAVSQSIRHGVPFLGICVGMQWMIDSSQEASGVRGLGLWPGECERFPVSVKSPHVGWNQLELRNGSSRLLRDISSGSFVYFTHSFRLPLLKTTVAQCEYGGKFSAAVEQGNLFGVQFHPEKSGPIGIRVLRNFCSL